MDTAKELQVKLMVSAFLRKQLSKATISEVAIACALTAASSSAIALTETKTFTDSQGRSSLFRYTLDDGWNPDVPRGVVIFLHGNNSASQQEIVDLFFPAVERDALSRGLIPVVMTSPETRSAPHDNIRQWKEPDELLLHEILQSGFKGSFTVDYDRVFFDGASQGTCFIHDFLPVYGEFYGGGFYGGCGCYGLPDPFWEPSDSFRAKFKVFVHTTQSDFLYETSHQGYGYYRYTLGLSTRGDLEGEGDHCSAYWTTRPRALDWLTGETEVARDPFFPHWKRIFVGELIAGVAVDRDSTVYVLKNHESEGGSLYSSLDGGNTWSKESELAFSGNDLDAVGEALFIVSGQDIYRSLDKGKSFSLLLQDGTLQPTMVSDQFANLYRGLDVIYRSSDFGASWQSLGMVPGFPAFEGVNSRFLNADTLAAINPQVITANPIVTEAYPWDEMPVPRGGLAVGSALGNEWRYFASESAPKDVFYSAAWDGFKLWALSKDTEYPYRAYLRKSYDRGENWVPVDLPAVLNAGGNESGPRVSALGVDNVIVHGNGPSWLTGDSATTWDRTYGGSSFIGATLAIDPNDNSVYATDGNSAFKLVAGESSPHNGGNHEPRGEVTISGDPIEGQTLTASNSLSDIDGLGMVSYQWLRNGEPIAAATGESYKLTQDDVAADVSVLASYTDGFGTAESVESASVSITNTNDLPTGTVTISGTASQGATLTATNDLADPDGLGAVNYQWAAGGTSLAGATATTLVLTQAEVGQVITVTASYVDAQGTQESVDSAPTEAVANVNDDPEGDVTIVGEATDGSTLTASNTLTDLDGLGDITYTWLAGEAELGTGSSYSLSQVDVGKSVSVRASYTDGFGTDESVTSDPTAPVYDVNDSPSGVVNISGDPVQNEFLTASNTLSDPDGMDSVIYAWLADGEVFGTGKAIQLTQSQVGKSITASASYEDDFGAYESVDSAPTPSVTNVNDDPTGGVSIVGAVHVGETLTASNNLQDADGLGDISYTWFADAEELAQGGSYELSGDDSGRVITVAASYTDGYGTEEAVVSDAVGPVAASVAELNGDPEDNRLLVDPGHAVVNAGEGKDTVQLPFFVTEFSLQEEAPGKVVGTYGDWSLELNDVELLEFGTGVQTTIPIEDVISGEAQAKVQKLSDLYLAFFGRAPDIEGLEYWQKVILETGLDLVEISEYFAQSVEAQALYPADVSNREFVRNIYLNAMSREPDPGGWDYWTAVLDATDPSDLAARGAFVGSVILSAYSDTSGPRDRDFLSNRHEVSLGYVNRLLEKPGESQDTAITDLLMRVTDDDATVAAAEDLLDFVFEDAVTLTDVMMDSALLDSFFG